VSYAALSDVQSEMGALKGALTATSVPTTTDVTNRILPDIAGEIDGVLSARGITVPVTTPSTFVDFLKATNALGAAARALAELRAVNLETTSLASWLQERYSERLDMLRQGEGIPLDATKGSGALPTSFHQRHPGSSSADFNDGEGDTDPVFTRDIKW
jgi:hypothetical protein